MLRSFLITSVLFTLLLLPLRVPAQDIAPGVQPTSLVRLTGVLETLQEPRLSSFPVLRVWLDDTPRVFRVAHVEAVVPAYQAEKHLRNISALGLRLLGTNEVRSALLSPTMHNRPIVIEGWLRPKAGVLQVRSVRIEEESKE